MQMLVDDLARRVLTLITIGFTAEEAAVYRASQTIDDQRLKRYSVAVTAAGDLERAQLRHFLVRARCARIM